MYKQQNQEIRILGFQAHGKNNINGPIDDFSGFMRSDLTNKSLPIYILAQDTDETKLPVCVPRLPTLPQETLGIPPFADFDVQSYSKTFFAPGKDGMTTEQFMKDFVPFTVVMNYRGNKIERTFSLDEVKKQISVFEKSVSMLNTPRVIRKPDATPVPLAPLQTIIKPQISLPRLKPLVPGHEDIPTGQIKP